MNEIREMIGSSIFSDLDRHFSRFIEAQTNGDFPLLALAAALTSRSRTEGHICLDLEALAETPFPEKPVEGMNPILLPGLATWAQELKSSSLVGSPAELRPLVMGTHQRLYLHRYWKYEQMLAAELLKRSSYAADESNDEGLGQNLKAFFPTDSTLDTVNLQSVAAFAAARGKFCVISGGPGTGKTHTLVLILALLSELDPARKLRIAVTTPTGKAATRIQESISKIKDSMECSEEIKSRLPENAITIHRLLGYQCRATLPMLRTIR
jgi:exodeoxyribonuclease V alpha subunit